MKPLALSSRNHATRKHRHRHLWWPFCENQRPNNLAHVPVQVRIPRVLTPGQDLLQLRPVKLQQWNTFVRQAVEKRQNVFLPTQQNKGVTSVGANRVGA